MKAALHGFYQLACRGVFCPSCIFYRGMAIGFVGCVAACGAIVLALNYLGLPK